MRHILLVAALLAVALVGCGGGKGRVKGKLVENGQDMKFPPTTAAVEFTLLKEDGTPDQTKVATTPVNEDGSFELVASGGEVQPGTYKVSIMLLAEPLKSKYPKLAPGVSTIKRKIVPGNNNFIIDLAKPD